MSNRIHPKQNDLYGEESLVSIGLPTRNRAHLLEEALEALLNQTYKKIEYVISDNASTDGTEALVRSYAARDSRIRYIRQKTDINGMENHEFVLREARGKYFMWASDDDWWHPRFVETLVSVLEKHPDYGVAMSNYRKRYVGGDNPRTEVITHNFTNLDHQTLYRRYMRGRVPTIFFFGLYRIGLLREIFRRKTPSCFNGMMITLSEVAFATHCYSVQEVLHEQLQDDRLHIVRHPNNPYTIGELEQFAVTRYVMKIPVWLLTSRVIPLRRKHLIFGPWLARARLYKRKMGREVWRFIKYNFFPFWQKKIQIGALLDRWLDSVNYVELADILFKIRYSAKKDRVGTLSLIHSRKQEFDSADDRVKKLEFLEAQIPAVAQMRLAL